MSSIRTRLNLGILTVLTVVFSAGGLAVYRQIEKGLYQAADRNLVALFRSEVDVLIMQLRPERPGWRDGFEGRGPAPDRFDANRFDSERPENEGGLGEGRGPRARRQRGPGGPPRPMMDPSERQDFLFQLWHGDQSHRSDRLSADLVPFESDDEPIVLTDLAPTQESFRTITCATASGEVVARALGVRFLPPIPEGRRPPAHVPHFDAVFAVDESNLADTLATVRGVLVGAGLLGLAASALALLFIARTSLSPLEELRRELEALDATRPEGRVGLDQSVAELEPIVDQMNELLRRVQGELQREKSFSSYVSHELRTPLTGLRLTMEMLLSRSRDTGAYEKGIHDCLDITKQMQDLVLKLLDFARADSITPELEEVDVPALIDETWVGLRDRADERKLTLKVANDGIGNLVTDRGLFERVAINLLDNAVDYADEGGVIDVRLSNGSEGTTRIAFSNASEKTRTEDGERALDAFWRADEARTVGHHCGLGLSLTQRIVQQLDGRIQARTEPGRFTVELELPSGGPKT